MTGLIQHDRLDIRRVKREYPFNTNTVGDLSNCEAGSSACSLAFDHIAFERLDPFFITLNDPVVHSDIITCFKCREFFLRGQLFVYLFSRFHVLVFKEGKGRVYDMIFQEYLDLSYEP